MSEQPADALTDDVLSPSAGLRRRLTRVLAADYLFTHLGFYALLPILPVFLRHFPGADPVAVGGAMFALTFTMRSASLVISNVLERLDARRCMSVALLLPGLSIPALAWAPSLTVAAALLVVAGLGISVNGLLSRVSVATQLERREDRLVVFSWINIAVNVSASCGPIVGSWIYATGSDSRLLSAVGGCYVLTATLMWWLMPPSTPPSGTYTLRQRVTGIIGLLRRRDVRPLLLTTAIGWFCYAQLFSALPLLLAEAVPDVRWAATYFTLNAVLVIVLQAAVTRISSRWLERGASGVHVMLRAGVVFGLAFALLAVTNDPLTIYAAVAVFSVAEMLFTPMVDTSFAELPGTSVTERFNVRQVVTSLGEAGGVFVGATGFQLAVDHSAGSLYWLVLTVLLALTLVTILGLGRRVAS